LEHNWNVAGSAWSVAAGVVNRSYWRSADRSGGGDVFVDFSQVVATNHCLQVAPGVTKRPGHFDCHDIFSDNGSYIIGGRYQGCSSMLL
jgi:hypothetical protein